MPSLRIVGALVLACTGLVAAEPICDTLAQGSNINIEEPLSIEYAQDQHEYWSAACGALKPTCILVPTTAEEVAAIVSALRQNNESFAFKSAGHNANRGFASIDGGPLINLKKLDEVNYDPETQTAQVGPGNRWTKLIKTLEAHNRTAVGGRIGHVGVGGYMTGGGLGYLSTQYGWAVDSAVEMEVVLADGSIVTASETQNKDLWRALRGGGGNYGIVTRFKIKTYPLGQVWGGNLLIPGEKSDEVLAALRDFTEYYPDDRAAIIATNELILATLAETWVLFLFWDGPEPPAGTFDNFTNVGPLLNTCKTQAYGDLVSAQDDLVITGQIFEATNEMSPLPDKAAGPKVLKSYYDHYHAVAKERAATPNLLTVMAMQPIPKSLVRKARENGGDLLDLDDSVDRILFEFNMAYNGLSLLSEIDQAMVDLHSGMHDRIHGFIDDGTLPDAYLPLFMNDANYQQDYFGRLRPEIHQFAKQTRDKYDPDGFFRDRTNMWKP